MRYVYPAPTIRLTKPETWVAVLDKHRKFAIVACECGALIDLANHTIASDGIVSPEVECDICGLKEQVQLMRWAAAA